VLNSSGVYQGYILETDAALGKAYISPGISATIYNPYGGYGDVFTIQLNTHVAVRLADGETQYYWVQNIARYDNGTLRALVLIWNETSIYNGLYPTDMWQNATSGNGGIVNMSYYVYLIRAYMYTAPKPLPLGWATLETAVGVENGSVAIRLYADGEEYDAVYITPYAPAVSADIVAAPNATPAGLPMDLEFVVAGDIGWYDETIITNGVIWL
jgi:hypothetical protein